MIAEVIVDISNRQVDKIFEYIFSNPAILPGSRVLVPFGTRLIEGYVINIKENSDYPAEKLKEIHSALDNEPVITQEMMRLKDYLSENYKLKIVDILRLFIPAQMRQGRVKPLNVSYASINEEINIDEINFSKAQSQQLQLLEYILECGEERVSELNKLFSPSSLKALIKKDIVRLYSKRQNRKPYKRLMTSEPGFLSLFPQQRKAYDSIINSSKTCLLHGITGSGKTEVYINCILDALERGKTAIMLVPEISLTPQMLKVFRERFQDKVAILHSALSAGERFDEWGRLKRGDATIAIGARSAIFAPLENLGVIIVDEEHDSSYISETNPRYDTLEIAEFRKKYNSCALVLGSATPSIESFYRAETGVYELLTMNERINKRKLPQIDIVDMTRELRSGNKSFISTKLASKLEKCLNKNQQVIIFLNRRGYASYQMCRSCGFVAKCPDCDVSMVYHRAENKLKCHFCLQRTDVLDVCPECGSDSIKQGSAGTEQIVSELHRMFPHSKILRMDNDTTSAKDAHQLILQKFASHEADILVGTQMVAKGHDFPNVTLVGIIEADLSLYASDFRAAEKTYQLITQVAGRAGRAELEGEVVLQTFIPKHYVYRFAVEGNYSSFYEKERNIREVTKFPPFSRIIRIISSDEREQTAIDNLKLIYERIQEIAEIYKSDFIYFKAMKSPIKRIQQKYRMQIVLRIKGDCLQVITSKIFGIVSDFDIEKKTSTIIEINPQNMS